MGSISNGLLHQITPNRSVAYIPFWKQPLPQYKPKTARDGQARTTLRRAYQRYATKRSSEKALLDELRRLSHGRDTAQPMLGPFMIPRGSVDEQSLRPEEYLHWSQVTWSERIRRIFRLGQNLLIVSFGGCLGIMVIYSITSELFAPSSTTNLMNMTIRKIEESSELGKVLKYPIKFHATPSGSSAKRTSGIAQSIHHATGVVELRFWVESCKKPSLVEGDWRSLDWWRSWIGPLITSSVHQQPTRLHGSLDSTGSSSSGCDDSQSSRWWPGLFKSIMPHTLAGSSPSAKSWSERFFSKHGPFEHGEVVAELIKEANGQWKYKSLVIDFPDSQNVEYRLNVWNELGKQPEQAGDGVTRYRFWRRQTVFERKSTGTQSRTSGEPRLTGDGRRTDTIRATQNDKKDKGFQRKKNTLKKIVANMTMGNDMAPLFSDIVQCMGIQVLEIKKIQARSRQIHNGRLSIGTLFTLWRKKEKESNVCSSLENRTHTIEILSFAL
ncbi:hypothetical protein VP01_786g1 [Puccinia sorghi]|uniref:Mitochondrial import inner membrane translocase subunit TIM21 n=1 Tax=Puccinia sorghi TaxID=27349 RepID=A0A0L6UD17_9BASI|nr:hypothetical protein VP01_786g1 [Puccinia sorghi]